MRSVNVALVAIAGAIVALAIAVVILAGAVASTAPTPTPVVCIFGAPGAGLPLVEAPGTCPPGVIDRRPP